MLQLVFSMQNTDTDLWAYGKLWAVLSCMIRILCASVEAIDLVKNVINLEPSNAES